MKKKNQYQIINYAVRFYSEQYKSTPEPIKLSTDYVKRLRKEYDEVSVGEFHFCCYGWQQYCWIDEFETGLDELSQKDVDDILYSAVAETRKYCRRDPRAYLFRRGTVGEWKDMLSLVIIMRDDPRFLADYVITFCNK